MKGIRKNAVMLPLPRKSRFECAYFILKREEEKYTEQDGSLAGMEMLAEAGRILQDSGLLERAVSQKKKRKRFWQALGAGALFFCSGAGFGLLLGALILR